ncbi:hypothetical protein EFBL_2898 [Effusibacillus lacus]|uniref:DUF1850 domain-containing protein n=2 Tax=Effusibacillus lacus TaxID=1348429 RepID=A0A292YE88_9BACL|nr:hypothetical protein EFBL_2898 [Effusibacillus lacus]
MAMKGRQFLIWLTGIIVIIWALNVPFLTSLAIKDGNSGQVLLSLPMKPDDSFSLRYIHSIHRTTVIEKYYIDEHLNLVVDEMIFDSYGVGIPSELEPGQQLAMENGKFILRNVNRKLPYFDQRIGQEIANHVLMVKGREIPLSWISLPGSSVRFQAIRETSLQYFERGLSQWLNKRILKP